MSGHQTSLLRPSLPVRSHVLPRWSQHLTFLNSSSLVKTQTRTLATHQSICSSTTTSIPDRHPRPSSPLAHLHTTDMAPHLDKSTCIIGAGAFGLTTLKNFLEAGFTAVAYERSAHIGGLWHVSNDTKQTTALKGTVSNLSKFMGCFSDFPYPECD